MSTLTIEEFNRHKRTMEDAISAYVSREMRDFRTRTGYSPKSIDIRLMDVSKFGDGKTEYVVRTIESEIDL